MFCMPQIRICYIVNMMSWSVVQSMYISKLLDGVQSNATDATPRQRHNIMYIINKKIACSFCLCSPCRVVLFTMCIYEYYIPIYNRIIKCHVWYLFPLLFNYLFWFEVKSSYMRWKIYMTGKSQ